MDSKPKIMLPHDLAEMSRRWAEQMIADYANGRNANSRAVSCFDAQSNVDLQHKAKMSECAFALFLGLDAKKVVHFGRNCDDGCDVVWRTKRWDIKATARGNKYLLWPIAKNHIFESKHFDNLVLVSHDPPHFWMEGWVQKSAFRHQHQVAGENHKLFPGTWFMHADHLMQPSAIMNICVVCGEIDGNMLRVGTPDSPPSGFPVHRTCLSGYDGQKDFAASLDVGYAAIRERMAAGGKPWSPKS